MTFKKTDLAKQMALKLDGKRKATQIPARFGKQSSQPASTNTPTQAAPKLVPVTCRLPAHLVQQLREKALSHPGGIHGLMSDAAQAWLSGPSNTTAPSAKPSAPQQRPPKAVKKAASQTATPTSAKKVAKKTAKQVAAKSTRKATP